MYPLSDTSSFRSNREHYDGGSILMHWLMALAIIGDFCAGLYMVNLPMSMARFKLYNYHKRAGAIVLLLAALRLL